MPPEPSWKNCKDCCEARLPYPTEEIREIIRRENLTTGGGVRELEGTINLSTLCVKCTKITPCSVCKEIVLTQKETGCNRLEISNWNKEPICAECKKIQCYRCGNYNDNDCNQLKTWWGWIMCEDCGMELCNKCCGECQHPCSACEKPCDADCGCSDGSGSEDDSSINENERPKNSIEEPHTGQDCKNCIIYKRSEVGLLKLLCDSCEYKHCSLCNKVDKLTKDYNGKTYKTQFIGYNNEPVCRVCKEHQCYICGEYDVDIDWKKKGLVGYANNPACEDCWWQGWCNECGDDEGGCDDRCPICNAVCDEHCGCDIECVKCGEEFAFEADIFRDRGISLQGGMNEDQICPNCWDETEGSKNSIEEPRACRNKYHNPMAWGYIGGRWRPEDCDICKSCCHCGKVLKEEEILNYDKGGDNFRQRNEWEEEWSEFMTAEEMKLPTCFACNDLSKAIDGDIFACWGCYNIGFCDYECKKCGIWCDNGSGEQRACKADGCEAWCVKCNKLKEGKPARTGGTGWICKTCENMKPAAVKKQRQKKMSVQYVYGLENEALPGIVKIAGCKADPTVYLNEALAMPTPLSLPFVWRLVNSKRVSDLQKKLDSLYALIEKKRIGNSDCFRISAEEFNKILDVIDEDSVSTEKRDMRKAFKDKQVVRHSIGGNTWSGIYDLAKNVIIYNNISYKSPSGFAKAHYSDVKSDRTTANGWVECQIEKEGVWAPIA